MFKIEISGIIIKNKVDFLAESAFMVWELYPLLKHGGFLRQQFNNRHLLL